MSRLYGDKENIDSEEVKSFFSERANRELESDLSIVLFQDKENSEQRHIEEKKLFYEHIDIEDKKVLEVGCGIGRWAEALHGRCKSFLGIDYTEDLIKIANKSYDFDDCKFQVMSATDIKADELLIEPPFDIILFSRVLMYINDDDIKLVFNELNKIGADDKKLFIMEPISRMDSRLTLKDFYSEGLEADYSAIYRTEEEYMELFEGLNYNKVFSDDIFEDLSDHRETHYKFFVIE